MSIENNMELDYPLNINQLKNIANKDHVCNTCLSRTQHVYEKYMNYLQNLKPDFDMYIHIFGTNNSNNSNNNNNSNNKWVITLNDFPYNVTPDIIHYVLWLPHENYSNEHIDIIINNAFKNYETKVWFINIPKYRSIKSIYHAHVFVI